MYMSMAECCALESSAVRKQVGSVLLLPDLTLSHGINGQPSGHPTEICEGSDGETLDTVLHSEIQAVMRVENAGGSVRDSILFCTMAPCSKCGEVLVSRKINSVYYKHKHSKSNLEFLKSKGVSCIQIM